MTEPWQLPFEDFEELAAAAPDHLRLAFVNGQVRTEDALSVEDFEELERQAPETFWLEYIGGELRVKGPGDGNHSCILMWLLRRLLQLRPDLSLYPNSGVKTEADRRGRTRTDGLLAPRHHLKGHGEWSDTDGFLMAVEITSRDHDSNRRRRIDKPIGYAAVEIPVYLLIDRDNATLTVFSEPEDGRYQQTSSYPWGATLDIPSPVNITLNTERLKNYADL